MLSEKLSLAERLSRHPRLHGRIEELLRIAEAEGAGLIKADDAEQQTIEAVRRLGNEVLTEWAQKRIEQCNTEQKTKETATQSGKKNSTGTVPSVK